MKESVRSRYVMEGIVPHQLRLRKVYARCVLADLLIVLLLLLVLAVQFGVLHLLREISHLLRFLFHGSNNRKE